MLVIQVKRETEAEWNYYNKAKGSIVAALADATIYEDSEKAVAVTVAGDLNALEDTPFHYRVVAFTESPCSVRWFDSMRGEGLARRPDGSCFLIYFTQFYTPPDGNFHYPSPCNQSVLEYSLPHGRKLTLNSLTNKLTIKTDGYTISDK